MIKGTWTHWLLGWLCVVLTVVFYGNFRETTWLGDLLSWARHSQLSSLSLPSILVDHLPSYLQSLFLGLTYLIFVKNSVNKAMIFSLLIAGILEAMQATNLLVGTFDWIDIVFIIFGAVSINVFIRERAANQNIEAQDHKSATLLMITSYFLALGCADEECNPENYNCVFPVTITWEEIRTDIVPSFGNETQLIRAGKVHAKGDHLFIIDEYRGVHIFDQTDPLNPIRLAFVPVIGALDLSLNGDYLYINSFTDLVTIQYQTVIDGSFTQEHISRKINVFGPSSPYDFLPDGFQIEGHHEKYLDYQINQLYYPGEYPKKGLIIGYYDANLEPVIFNDFKMKGIE